VVPLSDDSYGFASIAESRIGETPTFAVFQGVYPVFTNFTKRELFMRIITLLSALALACGLAAASRRSCCA
jgi:hypothetical protein